MSDIDYSTHMVNIKYDISWENSWRNNGDGTEFSADNWDAVWVFAKYRVSGGDWLHCTLATDGHTAPAGSVIENPSTGSDNRQTGVFVYRNATGFGSNNWDNCKIRWNYGTDNVADDADVEIRVFGIEMCFVPEGDFYLGDGISSGTFRQTGSNVPVLISDAPVVVKCSNTVNDDSQLEGDGILVDGDDGIDEDGTTTISNPDYPTGYKAFYCMKYEITQGQWVDFCNTITSSQASKLWYLNDTDRHGTLGGSYPYYTTTRQDRNKSFLGIVNGMAYSDWAGLRPMTELEFEKACRGSQSAVAREYAWGTNTVCPSVPMTIVGTENGTETISTDVSNGACLYGNNSFIGGDGGIGPLRAGIFARSATDRKSSGATYFGIMEMSGSLWESMGTLGNATGRGFAGSHGDGIMSADGYANISDWPGYISNKNSGATGSGFRGGAYYFQDANYECISHRVHAAYGEPVPYYDGGFRACRSK
ncbi:MAG: SUMF1/EgtB/PvdO family nonheme iron enzyme [Candidatus Aegiribacteria sp.]|nr:SUMF1/EgtB/PvdO family nonheme iron enzyme [Candidatus Aegiribacteria sp.]